MKHKHHIIPKHIGGTDDPSNLVELTIPEHAEAHKVLYDKYGRWQDQLAYRALSGMIGKEEIIWEIYKNRKGRLGKKHDGDLKRFGMANKGKKLTEEHKAKIDPTGRKQPKSQKIKVAEALSKPHIVTDPEGNEFRIKNLNKFARDNGLDQGNLTRVAQGKLRQTKGYKVRYA
jgi:hypothetical protein